MTGELHPHPPKVRANGEHMHISTYLSNTAVTSVGWSLVIISIHADSSLDACCGSSMNESSYSSNVESMSKAEEVPGATATDV